MSERGLAALLIALMTVPLLAHTAPYVYGNPKEPSTVFAAPLPHLAGAAHGRLLGHVGLCTVLSTVGVCTVLQRPLCRVAGDGRRGSGPAGDAAGTKASDGAHCVDATRPTGQQNGAVFRHRQAHDEQVRCGDKGGFDARITGMGHPNLA